MQSLVKLSRVVLSDSMKACLIVQLLNLGVCIRCCKFKELSHPLDAVVHRHLDAFDDRFFIVLSFHFLIVHSDLFHTFGRLFVLVRFVEIACIVEQLCCEKV
jgi:hypothetical protein